MVFDPNDRWTQAVSAVPHFRRRLLLERARKLISILRLYPTRLPRLLVDKRALDGRAHGSELSINCSLGRLRLDSHHARSQLREILISGAYAEPGFIPRSGWNIVDLGANLGFFSAWAMSFMRAGSLLAVEAVPETYEVMRANIDTARPPGVTVRTVNLAVTNVQGMLEFAVPDAFSNYARAVAHIGPLDGVSGIPRRAIPADSLNGIFGNQFAGTWPRIDLLKVDIEGSEVECLDGAEDVLPLTQRVVFEYHSKELLAQCAMRLARGGFRQVSVRGGLLDDKVGTSFWSR
jgi:FkbM family methyltransferase